MEREKLLQELSCMGPTEEIRKQLYELEPSITVSPPRSQLEIQEFIELAHAHGIPVGEDAVRELNQTGAFSGVVSEEYVQLSGGTAITAQPQPRYMTGGLHTHAFFEIICVLRGNVTQTICDHTMDLMDGNFCIIAPGVRHDLTIFSDAVVLCVSLRRSSFDLSFFKLLSPDDILHQFFTSVLYGSSDYPYILFRAGQDDSVLDLVLELYRESQYPGAYTNEFRFACMSMLFLRLLRNHSDHIQIGTPGNGNLAAVVPILQYMQEHSATVTRTTLAETFHYHEAYLSRLIKQATGQTFAQLLQELRLRKAQQLLATTDLPISEIVSMVGLSSVSHFHKIYRNRFGTTPRSIRGTTNR